MNIQKMMKQAQKMQEQLAQTQAELAERSVEATAGGGKVTVVANGSGEVISLKISPEVVDKDDVEMLEDLILSGVKLAQEKAKAMMEAEMGKITGGMGMPPGLGF
jgi:DNA-binding YbaB/EbfC family protein